MPSLAQSLTAKPAVVRVPSTLSWKTGTGSKRKPPQIQEKKPVIDLIHHLHIHRPTGLDEVHTRLLREPAEELTEPLSIIYQQTWLTGGVLADW